MHGLAVEGCRLDSRLVDAYSFGDLPKDPPISPADECGSDRQEETEPNGGYEIEAEDSEQSDKDEKRWKHHRAYPHLQLEPAVKIRKDAALWVTP
jgi:hypothetical protein